MPELENEYKQTKFSELCNVLCLELLDRNTNIKSKELQRNLRWNVRI